MEIQLLPPFNSRWKKGYKVFDSNSGRFRVVFYNSQEDMSGMSFARYVYSLYLGYEVPSEYEVDHINNDKTDDRINNLQLLTKEENRLKQAWWEAIMVVQWTILPCDYCKGLFYITQGDINNKLRKGLDHFFCSRSCATKYQYATNNCHIGKLIDNDDIKLIKQLRSTGLSSYKIADKTGFARNTVMKYW